MIPRGNEVLSRLLYLGRIKRRVAALRRHVVDRRKQRGIVGARRATGQDQARRGGNRQMGKPKARKHTRRHAFPAMHACLRPALARTIPCRSMSTAAMLLRPTMLQKCAEPQ